MELFINNQPLDNPVVIKIRSGMEADAARDALYDGADNVLFKLGNDVYVASGVAWDLKNVKVGAPVRFQGQTATVVAVNDEVNSAMDGFNSGLKIGAAGAAPAAAVTGAAGFLFTYAYQSGANRLMAEEAPSLPRFRAGRNALRFGARAGLLAAAVIPLVGMVGGAIDGALRRPDLGRLKGYGPEIR